jgi:hypothetical protein
LEETPWWVKRFAGLSAIKTAFDLAKGLKDIDDATRRNAAVIELQEKSLSAQSAQSALVENLKHRWLALKNGMQSAADVQQLFLMGH